jgi:putative transposase
MRRELAKAVEAEVTDFLGKHANLKTEDGHQRVVRHGHLSEREVMTGIGPVAVRQPRVRDRETAADDPKRCSLRRRALIRAFTKRFTNEIDGTLLLIVSRRFISTMVISSSSTDRCRPDCLSAQGSRQSGTCRRALAWQARSMPQRWRGGQTLTATARDDVSEPRVGTKKRALRSNKETNEDLPPWL